MREKDIVRNESNVPIGQQFRPSVDADRGRGTGSDCHARVAAKLPIEEGSVNVVENRA